MPDAIVSIKGQVTKIKPTDNVLSHKVSPCPGCGDDHEENRALKPWGFQGWELYCTLCNRSLGTIGS